MAKQLDVKIERPSFSEDRRAFEIACAGKRGQYIHPDDLDWLKGLYALYPGYAEYLKQRVFEATKPFGA